jgi:hypothetical protein
MNVTEPELQDPALVGEVDLARAAAQEEAGDEQVGEHVDTHVEGGTAVTHLFEADKAGYYGWRWAVTVASAGPDTDVTVSEVVLLPGPDALVAPDWVPWENRVQAGDLGVGDLLPTSPDDPRLVPAYLESDDPAVEEVAHEAGLGRARVLARLARLDVASRWQHSEFGPRSDMARSAPAHCGTCGFYLPLAGALRAAFGTCGNEISPADGHVVHVEYGCGAHSEAEVEQVSPVLVANLIYDDALLEVVPLDSPTEPAQDDEAAAEASAPATGTAAPSTEPSAATAAAQAPAAAEAPAVETPGAGTSAPAESSVAASEASGAGTSAAVPEAAETSAATPQAAAEPPAEPALSEPAGESHGIETSPAADLASPEPPSTPEPSAPITIAAEPTAATDAPALSEPAGETSGGTSAFPEVPSAPEASAPMAEAPALSETAGEMPGTETSPATETSAAATHTTPEAATAPAATPEAATTAPEATASEALASAPDGVAEDEAPEAGAPPRELSVPGISAMAADHLLTPSSTAERADVHEPADPGPAHAGFVVASSGETTALPNEAPPAASDESLDSTNAAEADKPEGDVEPAQPPAAAASATPGSTSDVEPGASAGTEPAEPGASAGSEPVEPGTGAEPVETSSDVESGTSAEPVEPSDADTPDEPGELTAAEPVAPLEPVVTAETSIGAAGPPTLTPWIRPEGAARQGEQPAGEQPGLFDDDTAQNTGQDTGPDTPPADGRRTEGD